MKPKSHEYFTSSKEAFTLFQEVVAFATAWVTNKELFAKIDDFTVAHNAGKANANEYYFSRTPSVYSFVGFAFSQGKQGGVISIGLIDAAFSLMEDKFLLFKNGTPVREGDSYSKTYTLNEEWIRYLKKNDLIYNDLLGFRCIIERYQHSVVKIEVHASNGHASIGTGWLLDIILPNTAERPRFVVTNAHVIEDCEHFNLLDKDDVPISHQEVEEFWQLERVDMALIRVDRQEAVPDFSMAKDTGMLAEVITMGYPAIPLARAAYQVVHRGEVNALVKDYLTGQELLIISARTAPGNSGSPVLDEMGRVVGMVTRELFEKEGFQQRGIAPYSACLPAVTINAMLNKSSLIRRLLPQDVLDNHVGDGGSEEATDL